MADGTAATTRRARAAGAREGRGRQVALPGRGHRVAATRDGDDLERLLAIAARLRDLGWGDDRHLLAQGVHPAHDALPRPLPLLHVREAARQARRARILTPDEVVAIAEAGARAGCKEALFTLGDRPEDALPGGARAGSPSAATPRRSSTCAPSRSA